MLATAIDVMLGVGVWVGGGGRSRGTRAEGAYRVRFASASVPSYLVSVTSARALLSDGKSNRQGNLSAHHETADTPAGLTYRTSVNHFVNRSAARRRAAATQFIPA